MATSPRTIKQTISLEGAEEISAAARGNGHGAVMAQLAVAPSAVHPAVYGRCPPRTGPLTQLSWRRA